MLHHAEEAPPQMAALPAKVGVFLFFGYPNRGRLSPEGCDQLMMDFQEYLTATDKKEGRDSKCLRDGDLSCLQQKGGLQPGGGHSGKRREDN